MQAIAEDTSPAPSVTFRNVLLAVVTNPLHNSSDSRRSECL